MASSSHDISLEYIKKGKFTLLLRAGYKYCRKSQYKNGAVFWECSQRKKHKCKGSITLKDNQIISEKLHNSCEPDFAENEIMLSLHKLKKAILNPDAPAIPTLYNQAVSKLKDTGIDKIKEFPPFKKIKTISYKHRNASFEVEKLEFKNVEDVKVPPTHHNFILADYNYNGIRLIAFCSDSARYYMKNVKQFLGDGTFWIATHPFYQLYTIHGDLGSTNNHTNIMPLVYVLMSHKTQKAYEILFSMIKSQIPEWTVNTFHCDFEVAAMNAVRKTFKNVNINGCYFHFTQAIWKKGTQLGLTKDKLTRRQVLLSAALPLLPSNKNIEGWFYIASQSPEDDQSKEFSSYMNNQWIKDDFIKVWCAFGQQHRTNNLVEAWNKRIRQRVSKKKPNIMKLLTSLAEDASHYEVLALRLTQGVGNITERSLKIIKKDNFIQEVLLELINGDITVGHCLEKLR